MHFSLSFYLLFVTLKILKATIVHLFCFGTYLGGNEYGQCGEEPSKDETGRPVRRDIVIPKRCASQLTVQQVIYAVKLSAFTSSFNAFFRLNHLYSGYCD